MRLWLKNNSLEKIYTLSLMLIATTMPFKWLQLNTICVLIMCALWLFDKNLKDRLNFSKHSKLTFMLSLIFLCYIFSVLYSENLTKGLSHLETRFSLLAFPLVLLSFYKIDERKLNLIL